MELYYLFFVFIFRTDFALLCFNYFLTLDIYLVFLFSKNLFALYSFFPFLFFKPSSIFPSLSIWLVV